MQLVTLRGWPEEAPLPEWVVPADLDDIRAWLKENAAPGIARVLGEAPLDYLRKRVEPDLPCGCDGPNVVCEGHVLVGLIELLGAPPKGTIVVPGNGARTDG